MSDDRFEETLGLLLLDIIAFLEELNHSKLSKHEVVKKSLLIDKLSRAAVDYPKLNLIKNVDDKVSSGSSSEELYEDLEQSGNMLEKNELSTDLIESSAEITSSIRGFLVKKTGRSKLGFVSKLKDLIGKKYCVVENGMFSVFDSNTSKKPSSSFPLFGYEVRVPILNKEFVFELICPGQRSFQFAAGSREELAKWTNTLKFEVLKNTVVTQPYFESSTGKLGKKYNYIKDIEAYEQSSEIENSTSYSSNPEDELYDDIATQNTSATMEAMECPLDETSEIYDDIVNTPSIPSCSHQSSLDVISNRPQNSTISNMTRLTSQNKSIVVSSKDGLPYDKMFYGKWDCSGSAKDELSFNHGDILTVLSQDFDNFGWWVAELKGTIGLVPRDYLTPAYELVTSQ